MTLVRRAATNGYVAVALLLGGCAGTAQPGADPRAAEPIVVEAAFAELEAYVEGFAAGDFRRMASVSTGAARLYADFRVAGLRAGTDPEPATAELTLSEPGDVLTRSDARLDLAAEARFDFGGREIVFDRFVVRASDGRWEVESYRRDGLPLERYVAAGQDEPVVSGAFEVAVDVAFHDPVTGALATVVTVANRGFEVQELPGYRAIFTSAESGRAYPLGELAGPGTVAVDATADLVIAFAEVDDGRSGGGLMLVLDPSGAAARFALNVPAFGSPSPAAVTASATPS